MEKKNVIFLSVIAVATLLTAVIGTTFAYFTAQLTASNETTGKNTSVTTKTVASAIFDYDNELNVTDAYPGWKGVKKFNISASGDTSSDPLYVKVTVTPTIATEFGTDVTWTLYATKSTSGNSATCTLGDLSIENGNYWYGSSTCTTTGLQAVIATSDGSATAKSVTLKVDPASTINLYLVAEYANKEATQNDAQGKTFSFDVTYTSGSQTGAVTVS